MPRRAGLRSRGIFYILIYWLDGETPSMTLPECTLGGFFRENKAAGVYRRHGNELSERTLGAIFRKNKASGVYRRHGNELPPNVRWERFFGRIRQLVFTGDMETSCRNAR